MSLIQSEGAKKGWVKRREKYGHNGISGPYYKKGEFENFARGEIEKLNLQLKTWNEALELFLKEKS